MTALWLISLRLQDVSIVDVFWGAGFAVLAIFYAVTTDGLLARQVLLVSLVAISGHEAGGSYLPAQPRET